MMKDMLKNIVAALKGEEAFKGVGFVYKNKREVARNPLTSFVFCCETGKTTYETKPLKNLESRFTTEINLCLLAPLGAGGKELSQKVQTAVEIIRDNFEFKEITAFDMRYLENSGIMYSQITVTISKEVEEPLPEEPPEESPVIEPVKFRLFLNSTEVGKVSLFEAVHTEELRTVYEHTELLNSSSLTEVEEVFNLSFEKTDPCSLPLENSTIKFVKDDYKEIYKGCSLIKTRKKLDSDGNLVYRYDLKANSYELEETEVLDE